jgi:protein-S-isoprenylcysteine O-methyltransferase Ste14
MRASGANHPALEDCRSAEAYLERALWDEYRAYKNRVGRWL